MRSQAIASCITVFFNQYACNFNTARTELIESCPSFLLRDKKVTWLKLYKKVCSTSLSSLQPIVFFESTLNSFTENAEFSKSIQFVKNILPIHQLQSQIVVLLNLSVLTFLNAVELYHLSSWHVSGTLATKQHLLVMFQFYSIYQQVQHWQHM